MYTFQWTPKDKEKSAFDGSVTVKVPDHIARMSFLKTLTVTVSETGELIQAEQIDISMKLVECAKKYIESVALVRKEDGFKVPDAKWLEYDIDGVDILGEIGRVLIDGVKLGKS